MLEVVSDDLTAGSVVGGRYRLERVVGEGGMGVVWAATHTLTGKKCALKFVKPARASDPRTYRRLLIEAQSACAVNHPNVALAHDVLELPSGVPFIVMDFLEGESLRARLNRQQRLTLQESARILLPVIDAVGAAHARGIVHRDLKPENVFLERAPGDEDRVKLLDFGIAKRAHDLLEASSGQVSSESPELTTFSALGTPSYMAPEQRGTSVDYRADIWALGVILFECLTGARPPFGNLPEPQKLAEILRKSAPELTSSEAATLSRLLAISPLLRPTLDELQLALRAHRSMETGSTTVLASRAEAPAKSPWSAGAWAFGVAAILAVVWAMQHGPEAARSETAPPEAQRVTVEPQRAAHAPAPVPAPEPVLATQSAVSPVALPTAASRAPAGATPSAAAVRARPTLHAARPASATSAAQPTTTPAPAVLMSDIPSHERH